MLPAFADLGHDRGAFPHAEQAADEVLSLPMFPELSEDQFVRVCEALRGLATTRTETGALA